MSRVLLLMASQSMPLNQGWRLISSIDAVPKRVAASVTHLQGSGRAATLIVPGQRHDSARGCEQKASVPLDQVLGLVGNGHIVRKHEGRLHDIAGPTTSNGSYKPSSR